MLSAHISAVFKHSAPSPYICAAASPAKLHSVAHRSRSLRSASVTICRILLNLCIVYAPGPRHCIYPPISSSVIMSNLSFKRGALRAPLNLYVMPSNHYHPREPRRRACIECRVPYARAEGGDDSHNRRCCHDPCNHFVKINQYHHSFLSSTAA